jgi:predicted acylesterase/phospholipase RssA
MAIVNRTAPTPPHEAQSQHDEARRELRFGLVLYGGVSLAVYIYGVALEFERLVRASCGVEENAWTEILRSAGATATVDIVSGASAGGINGVLLGKALATGAELRSVRSIWTDDADIGALLRDTGEKEPVSLLRTDRFRELLDGALETMDAGATGKPLVSVFDLFIASTRLQPWVRRFPTDLGGTVRTRDYRKSFELKLRHRGYNPARKEAGYDRNDFSAAANQTLADIARATSAFPVAFEPQLIERSPENERLFFAEEPQATYFSDGGILHNKPFTETISTIFTRAASRPVDRWLVSVEPDPERIPMQGEGVEPNVAEVASKAVLGIPRYQSIAADLSRLQEHRHRAATARERLAGIDEQLLRQIDELSPEEGETKEEALIAWRNDVLATSDYFPERQRRLRQTLVRLGFPASGEGWWAEDPIDELARMRGLDDGRELPDPEFEQRRIYHLLEMTRDLQRYPDLPEEVRAEIGRSKLQLWAQFDRVDELLWEFQNPAHRGEAEHDPGLRAARLLDRLFEVELGVAAICKDLDRHVFVHWRGDPERFTTVFRWFELWDAQLLTIAEVSGVDARDEIHFARISPADAEYIEKPTGEKLAGDALGHFGGFLKKSWRCNDLLWGRLDAAEVICRMIAGPADDGPKPLPQAQIRAVQEEIARAEIHDLSGDYRTYLERDYEVGKEKLADLPMDERADLALRSSDVIRNMLRGLGNARRLPGPLQWFFSRVGRGLGFLLAFARWPVHAIYGRDPAWRRTINLGVLFIGLWCIASLVLIVLGVIGTTITLWTLIVGGLFLFGLWTAGHALRR